MPIFLVSQTSDSGPPSCELEDYSSSVEEVYKAQELLQVMSGHKAGVLSTISRILDAGKGAILLRNLTVGTPK